MKRMLLNKNSFYLTVLIGISICSCQKESAFQFPQKPQVIIDAKRLANNSIHLVKDTVYILSVNLVRDSGQSILIDAGTLIKVNDNLSITINPGASIEAKGNATDPVVFTSSANKGKQGQGLNAGSWDGIRIYGNSNQWNSGVLSYVRVEFAGIYTSSLLLSQVGHLTTLDNIQISYSFNNASFELSGGDCYLSNLLSYASSGSDFLIINGYKGLLQNLIAYRAPFYATSGTNLAAVFISDLYTSPVISNLTVLGPDNKYGLAPDYSSGGTYRRGALVTTGNSTFHIRNSVFIDFPLRTYYLDDYNTADSLDKNISNIGHSIFYNSDTANIFLLREGAYPPYNSTDMKNFLLGNSYVNTILTDRNQFGLTDPYNYYDGIPNPMPKAGSPLLTGADFNSPFFADPFFQKVSYVGALGETNWLQGWTNFIPLRTDYNY